MLLSFIWFFALIYKVHTWESPWFLPNEDVIEQVQLNETVNNRTLIYMDENIQGNIIIAFINYKGVNQPTISQFMSPSSDANNQLGLEFTKQSEYWELTITKSQNFENIVQYVFEILADDSTQRVYVNINNLDDVAPIIQVSSERCIVEEYFVGETSCSMTIRDEDGVMEKTVIYTLSPDEGKFEMRNTKDLENGVKQWDVVLFVKEALDFETVSMYALDFMVQDSKNHNDTVTFIVYVKDVADELPQWKSIFLQVNVPEETEWVGTVSAIDGDIQINAPILYKIDSDKEYFKVDSVSGEVKIEGIDRDQEKVNIFTFTITAYEKDNDTSKIDEIITVIVSDINDNDPIITRDPDNIKIPESTLLTLEVSITVTDLDMGENANYAVSIVDSKFSQAFQIVPNIGYQTQSFQIFIVNAESLDYEDPEWRNFQLQVYAEEFQNKSHSDIKTIDISLTDWNDEFPVFDPESLLVKIPENVTAGQHIATMKAGDADEADIVKHSLLGSALNTFTIDELNGVIITKIDKALNYEIMPVVVVQIQATDGGHITNAQLTIEVQDVNDEQPIIKVGMAPINVTENAKIGTVINTEITASDVDGDSLLKFSIDWNRSWGEKNFLEVMKNLYEGCFEIKTALDITMKIATASFEVISNDNCIIDYEDFDTLHILVIVTDTHQTIEPKESEARIIISILDENDNPPKFDEDTLYNRIVTEKAEINRIIGTVHAEDIDGTGNNNVNYFISPNDISIPPEWIKIDSKRGEIYVGAHQAIDADEYPKEIDYTVTATDGENERNATITIEILDTNDKNSTCEFDKEQHILESSKWGTIIHTIKCTDGDRDEQYNTPWFYISATATEEIFQIFAIDRNNGSIWVSSQDPENDLDRDSGKLSFNIPFIVSDNEHQQNSSTQNPVEYLLKVHLDDINDNPPILKETPLFGMENMAKGDLIGTIVATDKDQANHDNSKIKFEIKDIKPKPGSGEIPTIDLFEIQIEDENSATLYAGRNLQTYYGTYVVEFELSDYGYPPQINPGYIDVTIEKYNFASPKFIYPTDNERILLAKTQTIGEQLITANNGKLRSFEVTDQQNEKWDMVITIDPATNPNNIFGINNLENNQANLILNSIPEGNNGHSLTLIADCQCTGEALPSTQINIKIYFIDNDSEPTFNVSSRVTEFPENTTEVSQELPKAFFNQEGEEWVDYIPYYFLHSGDMKNYFTINKETAVLTVVEKLDRELLSSFEITVSTSKDPNGNSTPIEDSILSVLVTVTDINDNIPYFSENLYNTGVKPTDNLDTRVLTIRAIDKDSVEKLNFEIGDISAIGDGIESIPNPFYLGSGYNNFEEFTLEVDLLLNFTVKSNMKGYFDFKVTVIDQVGHTNETSVKIYVVSELSRTTFKFDNNPTTVEAKKEMVEIVFENILKYVCNIETIALSTNENGVTVNNQTDVIAHFVNLETMEAIDSETIMQLASNAETFYNLRQQLLAEGLDLLDFDNSLPEPSNENELKSWLIAVSVVLSTLCLTLSIVFILKIRSLLKRLKKLSLPENKSYESPTNKIAPAPNTNRRAVEGSNTFFQKDKKPAEIDNQSYTSDDSVLFGAENNINFEYSNDFSNENYPPKEEDC